MDGSVSDEICVKTEVFNSCALVWLTLYVSVVILPKRGNTKVVFLLLFNIGP